MQAVVEHFRQHLSGKVDVVVGEKAFRGAEGVAVSVATPKSPSVDSYSSMNLVYIHVLSLQDFSELAGYMLRHWSWDFLWGKSTIFDQNNSLRFIQYYNEILLRGMLIDL